METGHTVESFQIFECVCKTLLASYQESTDEVPIGTDSYRKLSRTTENYQDSDQQSTKAIDSRRHEPFEPDQGRPATQCPQLL